MSDHKPRRAVPFELLDQLGLESEDLEKTAVRRALFDDADDYIPIVESYGAKRGEIETHEGCDIADVDKARSRLIDIGILSPRGGDQKPKRRIDIDDERVEQDICLSKRCLEQSEDHDLTDRYKPARGDDGHTGDDGESKALGTGKLLLAQKGQIWRRLAPFMVDTHSLAIICLIAVVGFVMAVIASLIPFREATSALTVPLVTSESKFCPKIEDATVISAAFGAEIEEDSSQSAIELTPSMPQGVVAAGLLRQAQGDSSWAECSVPSADQYIHIPGDEGSILTIVNPLSGEAVIDVTISGPDGQIVHDDLRGVTLPGGQKMTLVMSDVAKDTRAIGVRIRTTIGRVIAYADITKDDGNGIANSAQIAKELTISSIPTDIDFAELIVTNPGTTRNVISIDQITEAGTSILGDYDSYSLNAQRTINIDITEALRGRGGALRLSGRDLFSATAVVVKDNHMAIIPSVKSASLTTQMMGALPHGNGEVMVVNGSDHDAEVSIHWSSSEPEQISLPSGTMKKVAIRDQSDQVTVISDQQISGSAVIGSEGLSSIRLNSIPSTQASIPLVREPGLGR